MMPASQDIDIALNAMLRDTEQIVLSNRPRAAIVCADWPIVVHVSLQDQWLIIRTHADGRSIVYAGDAHAPDCAIDRGGFIVDAGEPVVRAIRKLSGFLGLLPALSARCIARLPAIDLV